WDSHRLT
ncbi:hypothetical protein EC82524_0903B, partial [Escherichia coli 8.2524]